MVNLSASHATHTPRRRSNSNRTRRKPMPNRHVSDESNGVYINPGHLQRRRWEAEPEVTWIHRIWIAGEIIRWLINQLVIQCRTDWPVLQSTPSHLITNCINFVAGTNERTRTFGIVRPVGRLCLTSARRHQRQLDSLCDTTNVPSQSIHSRVRTGLGASLVHRQTLRRFSVTSVWWLLTWYLTISGRRTPMSCERAWTCLCIIDSNNVNPNTKATSKVTFYHNYIRKVIQFVWSV